MVRSVLLRSLHSLGLALILCLSALLGESSLCSDALTCPCLAPADWQIATLVLLVSGATATLVAFLVAVISLCRGTQKQHYRTVAVFLFTAGATLSLLGPRAVGGLFCSCDN